MFIYIPNTKHFQGIYIPTIMITHLGISLKRVRNKTVRRWKGLVKVGDLIGCWDHELLDITHPPFHV